MPSPQQLISLVCPECSTRLRLTPDERPVGEFPCPDCGATLHAESSESGDIRLVPVTADVSPATAHPRRPQVIAITVTTLLLGVLLIVLFSGDSDPPVADADINNTPETTSSQSLPADIASEDPLLVDASTNSGSDNDSANMPLEEITDQIDIGALGAAPESLDTPRTDQPAARIPGVSQAGEDVPDTRGEQPAPDDSDAPVIPVVEAPVVPPFRDRLGIGIPSFDQTQATTLPKLLEVVELLAQVRIDTEAASSDSQRKPISFSLTDTTPLAILEEAGRLAGLEVVVDDNAELIRLVSVDK